MKKDDDITDLEKDEENIPENGGGDEDTDLKSLIKKAQEELGELQQKIKAANIPVIILFEGWGASGKGYIISKLISELDPRGFKVYTTGAYTSDEKRYPPMKRYWTKIPQYGQISIFDRSWYRDVSISFVEDGISNLETEHRFDDILDFEEQLADDGYVILKFFLKISKKEQKKRFEKLELNPSTRWRVTENDWRHHRMYSEYKNAFETMIQKTGKNYAPWHEVDACSKKRAVFEICRITEETFKAALLREKIKTAGEVRINPKIPVMPQKKLNQVNLCVKLEDEVYSQKLDSAQRRLFELHNLLYQKKIPLIIVYEGWDAAGKGGNIKRLTDGLDPRGYEVIPVGAPTPPELYRHYMWRFWNSLPKDGHIAIYDRSWYGRVMVERIEGFCTEEQWKRAFDEMNRFELTLRNWGAIIIKLWIHIDANEQLRRFTERQNTPQKQWKITDEDWRNRNKWELYETAVDDMLRYTNTSFAPWVIIEGNDKKYARVKALTSVIDHIVGSI